MPQREWTLERSSYFDMIIVDFGSIATVPWTMDGAEVERDAPSIIGGGDRRSAV